MYFIKRFVCVFIISNFSLVSSDLEKNESADKHILSDVLRNISIANNILQDLLSNYDRLKTNSNTEDYMESDSSDIDIDSIFRFLSSDTTNTPTNRASSEAPNNTPSGIRKLVTAMIYESHEISPEEINASDSANENTHSEKKLDILKQAIEKSSDDVDSSKSDNSSQKSSEVKIELSSPKPSDTTKLRYTIKRIPLNNKHDNSDKYKLFDNNTRRVQKIVNVETFPQQNIWRDVIEKPIKFNAPKKKNVINSETSENLSSSKILRDKYGEACLIVAIRKCIKGLSKARQYVCKQRFTCKSSLVSTFKNLSKTGCFNEFKDKKNKDKLRKTILSDTKAKTPNLSRSRFLDMCIPSFVPESEMVPNIIARDKPVIEHLNILRDKYEDQCKKLSTEKCQSACKFAYTETCIKHKCKKALTKAFGKACKKKCKEQYNMKLSSSESSTDSSDSSDSSSSDSSLSKRETV